MADLLVNKRQRLNSQTIANSQQQPTLISSSLSYAPRNLLRRDSGDFADIGITHTFFHHFFDYLMISMKKSENDCVAKVAMRINYTDYSTDPQVFVVLRHKLLEK